jgi:hypothetical protein
MIVIHFIALSLTLANGKKFTFEHVFGPSVGQDKVCAGRQASPQSLSLAQRLTQYQFFKESGIIPLLDRYTSHLTPHTSHLTPHTSHLTSHPSPHTPHLTPHTSHLTPLTSHLAPHTSHLTPHTSHLTPHTSHLTPHTSHLTPLISHLPSYLSLSAMDGFSATIFAFVVLIPLPPLLSCHVTFLQIRSNWQWKNTHNQVILHRH